MEKGIYLQYKNSQKEFFLSKNTPVHFVSALIKKAFHLSSDIRYLRHPRGYNIPLQDVMNFSISTAFEVVVDEDGSEDRSRSQTFSQKALTKRSGRKYPAHERELNDAKLFVDDFQLFMTEVASKKQQILLGVLFFNSKKACQYLGKKILRELIYEFDQIQFFYCLHPISRHSSSPLLGETLFFSLFKGTKMFRQREFPQNLSAIQQINGYLKLLIKNGELPECYDENQAPIEQPKQKVTRQNFIQLNEQRSFDAKVSNDLDFDLDLIPHKVQKSKTVMMQASPIQTIETPIKPLIQNQHQEVNQISFQNDFYQPEWFTEGNILNRLQKSFLSALIKSGQSEFVSFCHGLDLKNKAKQVLNIELVKVFLKDFINNKMADFSEEQKYLIQLNQENRQSVVFSLLLKLNKFGSIDDFLVNVRKQMRTLMTNKCSYVDLAREIRKKKSDGVIKLRGFDDQQGQETVSKNIDLVSKDAALEPKYTKIANLFHTSQNIMQVPTRIPNLPAEFSESEKAIIIDGILHQDAFLIENYIESKWSKKKFMVFEPKTVRRYINASNGVQDWGILKSFPFEPKLKNKLNKFFCFRSLLYYLYKQRLISLKQKKAFFYLYIWSDLNTLATFELYCLDRNLDDFVETMFTIDYHYYLEGKYGVDMGEVENFTDIIKVQLAILFILSEFFDNASQRTTLQKFIRAGDSTLLETLGTSRDQKQLIETLIQISEDKKRQFEQIKETGQNQERILQQKKQQMLQFTHSIIPVHYKQFAKKQQLLKDCIENMQPCIHGMFDVYFQTKELVEWMDTFEVYVNNFDEIHMKLMLKLIAERHTVDYAELQKCRTDLVKAVYQVYVENKDEADAAETMERIIQKSGQAREDSGEKGVQSKQG